MHKNSQACVSGGNAGGEEGWSVSLSLSLCVFTSPVILVNYACRGSLQGRWSGLGGITYTRTSHHTKVTLLHRHQNHEAKLTCSETT